MSKLVNIAIGSTLSLPGDVAGNLRQIDTLSAFAAHDGAHLLLTPELSVTGYGIFPEVLATAEVAGQGPVYQGLASIAQRDALVICAGFVEQHGEKRHLSHYIIYPDGQFLVQRKHRVTPAEHAFTPIVPLIREHAEDDCGQPATLELTDFTVAGVRCALLICADIGIRDIQALLYARGVELLLCPTAAGGTREQRVTTSELQTPAGRHRYLQALQALFFPGDGQFIADCLQYGWAMAAVNQGGFDGQQYYHAGHGMIITPMGEVPGFFHGIPNIDRQRPCYAHALVDVAARLAPLPITDASGRGEG